MRGQNSRDAEIRARFFEPAMLPTNGYTMQVKASLRCKLNIRTYGGQVKHYFDAIIAAIFWMVLRGADCVDELLTALLFTVRRKQGMIACLSKPQQELKDMRIMLQNLATLNELVKFGLAMFKNCLQGAKPPALSFLSSCRWCKGYYPRYAYVTQSYHVRTNMQNEWLYKLQLT